MERRSRKFWLIPPLFVLCFGLGCLLGILIPEREEPLTVLEATEEPVQTQQETETTLPLTLEERLYADYLNFVEAYQETELADLDGDGTPELLIYNGGSLKEVAAIAEGAVVQVLEGYALFRCDNGIIGRYSEGAGGCTGFFYEIRDGMANCVECLVYHWHEDAWYRSTDYSANDASLLPISEAERQSVLEKYVCIDKNADDPAIQAIYG